MVALHKLYSLNCFIGECWIVFLSILTKYHQEIKIVKKKIRQKHKLLLMIIEKKKEIAALGYSQLIVSLYLNPPLRAGSLCVAGQCTRCISIWVNYTRLFCLQSLVSPATQNHLSRAMYSRSRHAVVLHSKN